MLKIGLADAFQARGRSGVDPRARRESADAPAAAERSGGGLDGRVPRGIGYLVKMYPRFSETFILNELLELERQGLVLTVFALKKPDEGRFHADLARLRARVHYAPESATARPGELLGAMRDAQRLAGPRFWQGLAAATRRRRSGSLKHFWQAAYLAHRVHAARIGHLHAHFASSAAGVAWQVAHLLGISYSVTAHAKDIFRHDLDPAALARKLRDARFVVTVSDFNRAYLEERIPGLRPVRIYNGLDLASFAPRPTPKDKPPLVLGVGRLVEKKGFDDLLRAAAILRDQGLAFRCVVVGSGEEQARLERLRAELDLSGVVDLAGPLPREALLDLYPRASVFAAPCVVGADGNRDGLPTVLIEAMALGLPVVATPVTGIPELVRAGDTGLIVPERAPGDLAAAIARLLGDPALALVLAARGRARVEAGFDLGRNAADLRRLLEGAVA